MCNCGIVHRVVVAAKAANMLPYIMWCTKCGDWADITMKTALQLVADGALERH